MYDYSHLFTVSTPEELRAKQDRIIRISKWFAQFQYGFPITDFQQGCPSAKAMVDRLFPEFEPSINLYLEKYPKDFLA